jgi:hypothetical protein
MRDARAKDQPVRPVVGDELPSWAEEGTTPSGAETEQAPVIPMTAPQPEQEAALPDTPEGAPEPASEAPPAPLTRAEVMARRMRQRMIDAGLIPIDEGEEEPQSTPYATYTVSRIRGGGSVRGGVVTWEYDGAWPTPWTP